MAADDPVDETALIFTEADVYMVAGFLAEYWEVEIEDDEMVARDTEHAVTNVLAHEA